MKPNLKLKHQKKGEKTPWKEEKADEKKKICKRSNSNEFTFRALTLQQAFCNSTSTRGNSSPVQKPTHNLLTCKNENRIEKEKKKKKKEHNNTGIYMQRQPGKEMANLEFSRILHPLRCSLIQQLHYVDLLVHICLKEYS